MTFASAGLRYSRWSSESSLLGRFMDTLLPRPCGTREACQSRQDVVRLEPELWSGRHHALPHRRVVPEPPAVLTACAGMPPENTSEGHRRPDPTGMSVGNRILGLRVGTPRTICCLPRLRLPAALPTSVFSRGCERTDARYEETFPTKEIEAASRSQR